MPVPKYRILHPVPPVSLFSVVLLLLGAGACGDDPSVAPREEPDAGMEAPEIETEADASVVQADASAVQAYFSAEDLAAGKAVMLRSCGACHIYAHPKLSVVTPDGHDIDESKVEDRGADMIARVRDAARPMPPADVSGILRLTDEEQELVIAYIESVLAR
jgi:mono/diheme cytochrome c family protein